MEQDKHKEILKKFYLWLSKHVVWVIRFLYISPLIAVIISNDRILWTVMLFDVAVAITYSAGNSQKWYEDE